MLTQPNFSDWLEEKFIDGNVYGETPITKDNVEKLFENYILDLDTDELMDLATEYGQVMFKLGKETEFDTTPH